MAISWDPSLYAANTAHHRAYDNSVLSVLDIAPNWRVLDIGSGAGDLSGRVARLVPNGEVVGIDASAELVEHARASHGEVENLSFHHLRAQELSELWVCFPDLPRRFDLVLSTACLHWVPGPDHLELYRSISALLDDGGQFRAEFGGSGQMADTLGVLDEESTRLGGVTSPWYFPPVAEVHANLAAAGFDPTAGFVRLDPQERSMPDLDALIGWLDSQVLIAYAPHFAEEARTAFREAVVDRLSVESRRADGSYDQHYVRLDLLAVKA